MLGCYYVPNPYLSLPFGVCKLIILLSISKKKPLYLPETCEKNSNYLQWIHYIVSFHFTYKLNLFLQLTQCPCGQSFSKLNPKQRHRDVPAAYQITLGAPSVPSKPLKLVRVWFSSNVMQTLMAKFIFYFLRALFAFARSLLLIIWMTPLYLCWWNIVFNQALYNLCVFHMQWFMSSVCRHCSTCT